MAVTVECSHKETMPLIAIDRRFTVYYDECKDCGYHQIHKVQTKSKQYSCTNCGNQWNGEKAACPGCRTRSFVFHARFTGMRIATMEIKVNRKQYRRQKEKRLKVVTKRGSKRLNGTNQVREIH